MYSGSCSDDSEKVSIVSHIFIFLSVGVFVVVTLMVVVELLTQYSDEIKLNSTGPDREVGLKILLVILKLSVQ